MVRDWLFFYRGNLSPRCVRGLGPSNPLLAVVEGALFSHFFGATTEAVWSKKCKFFLGFR